MNYYSGSLPDYNLFTIFQSLFTTMFVVFWFVITGNLVLYGNRMIKVFDGMLIIIQYLLGATVCYLLLSIYGLLGILNLKIIIINFFVITILNLLLPQYRQKLIITFYKSKTAILGAIKGNDTSILKILKLSVIILVSYQLLQTLLTYPKVHDAVGYYLYAAKMWSIYGDLRPLLETHIANLQFYPVFTELFYTVCLFFDSTGVSAKLIHHSFGLVALIAGYSIVKNLMDRKTGWIFMLLMITLPVYTYLVNSSKLDLVFSAFAVTSAYLYFCHGKSIHTLILIFLFLFISIIAKLTAGFIIAPLLLLIVWDYLRFRNYKILFTAGAISLFLALIVTLPWLSRSLKFTGTPFYSLYINKDVEFKSGGRSSYWINQNKAHLIPKTGVKSRNVMPDFHLNFIGRKIKKIIWNWAMGDIWTVHNISPTVLYISLLSVGFVNNVTLRRIYFMIFLSILLFFVISSQNKPIITRYIFPSVIMMTIFATGFIYTIVEKYHNKTLFVLITCLVLLQPLRYGFHDSAIVSFMQSLRLRTLGDEKGRQQYFSKLLSGRGVNMFAFLNDFPDDFSIFTNGTFFRFYSNHPVHDKYSSLYKILKLHDNDIKPDILTDFNIKYVIFNTSYWRNEPLFLDGRNVSEMKNLLNQDIQSKYKNKWSTDIFNEEFFDKYLRLVYTDKIKGDFIFEFYQS